MMTGGTPIYGTPHMGFYMVDQPQIRFEKNPPRPSCLWKGAQHPMHHPGKNDRTKTWTATGGWRLPYGVDVGQMLNEFYPEKTSRNFMDQFEMCWLNGHFVRLVLVEYPLKSYCEGKQSERFVPNKEVRWSNGSRPRFIVVKEPQTRLEEMVFKVQQMQMKHKPDGQHNLKFRRNGPLNTVFTCFDDKQLLYDKYRIVNWRLHQNSGIQLEDTQVERSENEGLNYPPIPWAS